MTERETEMPVFLDSNIVLYALSDDEKFEAVANCDHLVKTPVPTVSPASTFHAALMFTTRNKHDPPVRVTTSASNPNPCITHPFTPITRNNPQEHTLC